MQLGDTQEDWLCRASQICCGLLKEFVCQAFNAETIQGVKRVTDQEKAKVSGTKTPIN